MTVTLSDLPTAPTLPPELKLELESLGLSLATTPTPEQWHLLLEKFSRYMRSPTGQLSAFGYRIGHELRTPLTVVVGASELLLESRLDSSQRQAVQSIRRAGQELQSVVDQILNDLSEGGKSSPPLGASLRPVAQPAFDLTLTERRILVAEDNEFNRVLIERALAQLGCKVDSVKSGREALKRLAAGVYDLVLMDCQMSGMDGVEATREIRKLERGTQRVPIIAVTASTAFGGRRRCLAAGMDDFIAKPFALSKLRSKVRHWLAAGKRRGEPKGAPHLVAGESALHSTALPSESASVLDLSRLEELAVEAGSTEIVLELALIFMQDVEQRLVSLAQARDAGDLGEMLALAHSVRGASANFGATRMARVAEALERKAHDSELSQVPSLITELVREFARVRLELETRVLSRSVV